MSERQRPAPARDALRRAAGWLPLQCLLAAAVLWAAHLWLARVVRSREPFYLGSLTPRHLAPLYAEWERGMSVWALPALVIIGGLLFFARRRLLEPRGGGRATVAAGVAWFLAIACGVAMIDGYRWTGEDRLPALIEPYSRTHDPASGLPIEFYADVDLVRDLGPAAFLARYDELGEPQDPAARALLPPRDPGAPPDRGIFLQLSTHGQTHPPGPALFLWAVTAVLGRNLWTASLASIAFTSLGVIPVYLLARRLRNERAARLSLALLLLTPSFVMFAATSMDGPTSVPILWGLYLAYRAVEERPALLGALAGLALTAAALMTYATVAVGLFLVLAAALGLRSGAVAPERLRRAALAAAAVGCGCFVLLFRLADFNILKAARLSMLKDYAHLGTGYESVGRYLHLSFGNLFAFLLMLGLPALVLWVREVAAQARVPDSDGRWRAFVLAGALTVAILAFSTLFTMEVERIWIFLAPLAVIPAAARLGELAKGERGREAFWWTVGLAAAQLVAFEALLNTYW